MKRLLIMIFGLISIAYGQSVGQFRYDSTMFLKNGGNNELIILNGTRGVTGGVLTNIGNGRTRFVTPAAGIGTASNGLTKVGSDVKLGGTLTQNTTIDFNGDNLTYATNGGYFLINSDDVGNVVMGFKKDVDVANRMQIQADGHIEWGDGTGNIDVGITRSGDGELTIGGGANNTKLYFSTGTTDSSLIIFGPDGVSPHRDAALYYDIANHYLGIDTYAGKLKIDTLNYSSNTDDSMMVWRKSSGDVGMRAIPTVSVTPSSTTTFTNKRWTARIGSTTSSATPTINTDNTDIYKLTAQSAAITSFTTNLSGAPNDGDILEIQITGTATRNITWGSAFVSTTVTLPAATDGTNTLTAIFQYYTTSSYGNNKWHIVNYY